MNELYHYGVKGMKWGIRRDRKPSSSYNKNYTEKQRKSDRTFYGQGAEKRINKRLNKGHGLKSARHIEVQRRDKREARKKTAKKIARKGLRAAGRALTTIGSMLITDQVTTGGAGRKAVGTMAKAAGRAAVSAYMRRHGHENIRWYN